MKTSIYLHLSLTEGESTQIAVAAYYAGLPLNEWVKQTLLNNANVEKPATIPAQPTRALRTTPSLAPPVPQSSLQPDGELAEPETAEAEPEAPAPAPAPATVPPAPVVAEPTPPEPPAPEPEPEPEPPAQKQKRTRQTSPPGVVPRGFEPIMQMAEKIIAARKNVAEKTGTTSGYSYNMAMREWYQNSGLADLAVHFRSQIGTIGQNAAAIRKWAARQPAGTIAADILPYTLLKLFEDTATDVDLAAVAGELEDDAEPSGPTETAPTEPSSAEPATAEAASPSDETLIVEGGKIRRGSLSAYLNGRPNGASNGGAAAEPSVDLRKGSSGSVSVRNFTEVSLDELNPYDARVVRRFTERIVNLGGAGVPLSEADIALAIRKIRGNESGDNPPCAMCLMRLGVIGGASGAFRLRPEYVGRFDDVRAWASV